MALRFTSASKSTLPHTEAQPFLETSSIYVRLKKSTLPHTEAQPFLETPSIYVRLKKSTLPHTEAQPFRETSPFSTEGPADFVLVSMSSTKRSRQRSNSASPVDVGRLAASTCCAWPVRCHRANPCSEVTDPSCRLPLPTFG